MSNSGGKRSDCVFFGDWGTGKEAGEGKVLQWFGAPCFSGL